MLSLPQAMSFEHKAMWASMKWTEINNIKASNTTSNLGMQMSLFSHRSLRFELQRNQNYLVLVFPEGYSMAKE